MLPFDAISLLPPPVVLGILLATFYAFAFKAIAGQRSEALPACLLASLVGFGLGHLVGTFLVASAVTIGELHVVEGSLGAWIVLLLVNRPYL